MAGPKTRRRLRGGAVILSPNRNNHSGKAAKTQKAHRGSVAVEATRLLTSGLESTNTGIVLAEDKSACLPLPSEMNVTRCRGTSTFVDVRCSDAPSHATEKTAACCCRPFRRRLTTGVRSGMVTVAGLESQNCETKSCRIVERGGHGTILVRLKCLDGPTRRTLVSSTRCRRSTATKVCRKLTHCFGG